MRAPSSLYLERRLTECVERVDGIGGGIGQHRLHRLERPQRERREAGFALDECRTCNRSQIAGQHHRPADPGRRDAGGSGNGVGQHALQRTLTQFAEEEPPEKILLGVSRGGHQLAEQFPTRRR